MAKKDKKKKSSIDYSEFTPEKQYDPGFKPDYDGECEVCGASPIVPATGLCGPCTWGEADTAGGNW